MFKRLGNIIRGFFSLFVSGLEKQNPEALLEVEKNNLRAQIGQYNQGLASHAALCERLISQVRRLEVQEKEFRAKTAAHLRAGNREAAGQLALQLQGVTAQLSENKTQAEQAEKTYQDLIRARDVAVRTATDKIEKLKSALGDLKVKKATAELNEMASGMITQIGGAGDTLNRLSEMVEEERDKAAGRARIARDSLDMSDINVKASEQSALADQALADFAAKEGIVLDAPPAAAEPASPSSTISAPPPPAIKQMGPQAG